MGVSEGGDCRGEYTHHLNTLLTDAKKGVQVTWFMDSNNRNKLFESKGLSYETVLESMMSKTYKSLADDCDWEPAKLPKNCHGLLAHES